MFNYSMYRSQKLPISIDEAWAFFSIPHNLEHLAPPYNNFQVLTNHKLEKAYAGQIICYRLTPLLGIPLFWMSEITHLREGEYFVDEARHGPFAFWHHQHFFTPIPGGVLVEDLLHYKLPLGFIGAMAHSIHIKKQLEEIFDYRAKRMQEMFGSL